MTTQLRANSLPQVQRSNEAVGSRDINVGYYERMASTIGGPLLAIYGLSRGTPAGVGLAVLGGALLYRGVTGHCTVYNALGISTVDQQAGSLHVEKSVTIGRPAEELYAFWRNFENLPHFMKHLDTVTTDGHDHSHWVANGPAGTKVEWDAEITTDQPGHMISWRSLPNAQVDNSGVVRFEPAPADRGTIVHVSLDYNPPAGALGAAVAKLFGEEPSQQIEGDLRRFKNIMEAGEIPTTTGQSAGQRSAIGKLFKPEQKPEDADQATKAQLVGETTDQPTKPFQPRKPPVTEASEESFPASDAPAWTGNAATGHEKELGS